MAKASFPTPDWLKTGIMYQIFPDRFSRSSNYTPPPMDKDYVLRDDWGGEPVSGPDDRGVVRNNDFFGGNLDGIREKLPYLQSLGITVLYLNPIFEAYSNHRYDTGDYKKIDPLLGDEASFRDLCRAAAACGIRILLDGVFNHTGSDSLYFNKNGRYPGPGAFQSKNSPYYPWFKFTEYPNRYESWWGIDTLPSVREEEPSYLDYMLRGEDAVAVRWLRQGASGWRLDVVDELPDVFLDTLRQVVKNQDPDAALIGEVWEDASTKVSYGQKRRYLDGRQLDSVMNYPLRTAILRFLLEDRDGSAFALVVDTLQAHYPDSVFYSLMNFLGTHDTPRIRTVIGEGRPEEEGRQLLFLALLLWALLPGIPCVYYGDELGMTGGKDPANRGCFEEEKADPGIQSFYRRVLAFRTASEAAAQGTAMQFSTLEGRAGFYSFTRTGADVRLIVGVNPGLLASELDLAMRPGEAIDDFVIAGDVVFSSPTSFRLSPGAGIAVRIRR